MRWSASVALLIALCVLSLSALAQPATEAEGPDESAEGPQSIEDLDPADIEKAYGIACEAAGMELDLTKRSRLAIPTMANTPWAFEPLQRRGHWPMPWLDSGTDGTRFRSCLTAYLHAPERHGSLVGTTG